MTLETSGWFTQENVLSVGKYIDNCPPIVYSFILCNIEDRLVCAGIIEKLKEKGKELLLLNEVNWG